jgi:hypothetical protein
VANAGTGLVSKKCKSLSKKSEIKSSLSFVTSQTGGQWAADAAKARHPKYMRSGYEKMRPVSQKVGIRCPFPKFLGWPLVGGARSAHAVKRLMVIG